MKLRASLKIWPFSMPTSTNCGVMPWEVTVTPRDLNKQSKQLSGCVCLKREIGKWTHLDLRGVDVALLEQKRSLRIE